MKLLIVTACLLAVASAGDLGYSSYAPYGHQAAHIPVLDHNGFQVDTPEVQHAKAAHFAAYAEVQARNGHSGVYGHAVAPVAHAYNVAPVAHAPLAHAVAPLGYAAHHGIHIPSFDHNGYQIDTPEVQHARAAHFAAYNQAAAHSAHYRKRRGVIATPLAYAHGYQHIPVIGHNGVPLDTPEVSHAKAVHFAAHAEAHARNGHVAVAPLAYASHGVVAPLAYAHGLYHGPQHLPVIGPNGVPLDTPEVTAGKAANAVFHAEAHARNGDYTVVAPYAAHVTPLAAHVAPLAIAHHGVLDTPEVAHAKAAHFAAHAEALARNHHY